MKYNIIWYKELQIIILNLFKQNEMKKCNKFQFYENNILKS